MRVHAIDKKSTTKTHKVLTRWVDENARNAMKRLGRRVELGEHPCQIDRGRPFRLVFPCPNPESDHARASDVESASFSFLETCTSISQKKRNGNPKSESKSKHEKKVWPYTCQSVSLIVTRASAFAGSRAPAAGHFSARDAREDTAQTRGVVLRKRVPILAMGMRSGEVTPPFLRKVYVSCRAVRIRGTWHAIRFSASHHPRTLTLPFRST